MTSKSELMDSNGNGPPDGVSSDGTRHAARRIAFVLASAALATACVVLALQYFFAERLPEMTEATLQAAIERWKEHGPASYDMEIDLRGAQPGRVHVEVRNKEVTAQTRNGRVPGRWTWDTWSVPGLFDTLGQDLQTAENPEQEIQAAPDTKWRLRCEFDPNLGIPLRYHRLVTGGGPEVYWQVIEFQSK
jgi:hypothetical protein